jgi:GNAT superfamily N-acetyltransferase
MNHQIIEGAEHMPLADIVRLLHTTYWAGQRPVEKIEASLRGSDCYGVWLPEEEKLVGFARVISDHATTYYLCDVVIDEAYRGQGLGKALLAHIEACPRYDGLRGLLMTRDAHGLYEKFGFRTVEGRAMAKGPGR